MSPEERSSHRERARARTESWLRHAVIGLGLCPFARAPVEAGTLRLVVSAAEAEEELLADLEEELLRLGESPEEELSTTLWVSPFALESFDSFLLFADLADWLLGSLGLRGVLQIASFHPDYLFEGEDPAAPSHFTNRSPYPTLHLLREASLSRAIDGHPDPSAIPRRNIRLMSRIGATDPQRLERLRRGECPSEEPS